MGCRAWDLGFRVFSRLRPKGNITTTPKVYGIRDFSAIFVGVWPLWYLLLRSRYLTGYPGVSQN